MKPVFLPDEIAEILEKIPEDKRGDFLYTNGFPKKFQTSIFSQASFEVGEKKDGSYQLFTDGAARGNPGLAGAGFLIQDEKGNALFLGKKYLGVATNNQAEWQALLLGLEKALEFNISSLSCFLDSELVVHQINGKYKVKHPDLLPFFQKAKEMRARFENVSFAHIPREKNSEADRLSNEAIDHR